MDTAGLIVSIVLLVALVSALSLVSSTKAVIFLAVALLCSLGSVITFAVLCYQENNKNCNQQTLEFTGKADMWVCTSHGDPKL